MDFGAILGAKMEPKSMKKGVGKMMKKTMTTKMAKKSNIGAYEWIRHHDFGARGGGRRRGKPLPQGSWRKLEDRVEWMMEGS